MVRLDQESFPTLIDIVMGGYAFSRADSRMFRVRPAQPSRHPAGGRGGCNPGVTPRTRHVPTPCPALQMSPPRRSEGPKPPDHVTAQTPESGTRSGSPWEPGPLVPVQTAAFGSPQRRPQMFANEVSPSPPRGARIRKGWNLRRSENASLSSVSLRSVINAFAVVLIYFHTNCHYSTLMDPRTVLSPC